MMRSAFLPVLLAAISLPSLHAQLAPSQVWVADGPQPLAPNGTSPVSGRATSIALHPTNPNIAYLGTAGGGVWKTTDGGANWTPTTDQQVKLSIGAVAVAPSNPNIIYAGMGENSFAIDSTPGLGILRSDDGGTTWLRTSYNFQNSFNNGPSTYALAVDPTNPAVVVAALSAGLFRSTDSGATWTNVLAQPSTAVLFDKNDPNTLYAGINSLYTNASYSSAVYKSTDKGATWTPLGIGILPASNTVIGTSLAQDTNGGTLYAGLAKSDYSAPGYLYKSTNGGTTWTKLTSPPQALDWYSNALTVVPGSNTLYAAGFRLQASTDGGQSWQAVTDPTPFIHQKAMAVTADGNTMYLANEGGVYKTQNPTSPASLYTPLNQTLNTMTFAKGFSILDDGSVFAGAYGHGMLTGGAGKAWKNADNYTQCFGGATVLLSQSKQYAYAKCGDGTANWLRNTAGLSNPGAWQRAETGINFGEPIPFTAPLEEDASTGTVYTSTTRLYRSTDHAGSWQSISPVLTTRTGAFISTIAVSKSNPNVVYVGSNDGTIAFTTNALSGSSATWSFRRDTDFPITKIAVDPDDDTTYWVSYGGTGYNNFLTFNNRVTQSSTAAIEPRYDSAPIAPNESVVIDPALIGVGYLATDRTVYRVYNQQESAFAANLPNVVVEDLKLDPNTRRLYALTHGRGAWHLDLGEAKPFAPGLDGAVATDFGYKYLGGTYTASRPVQADLRNKTVHVLSVTTTGPYTQTNNCTAALNPLDSCTVQISFHPTGADFSQQPGTLIFTTDQGTQTFNLTGIGVAQGSCPYSPKSGSCS